MLIMKYLEKHIYISKGYIVEGIMKCMVMCLLLNIKHQFYYVCLLWSAPNIMSVLYGA